MEHLLASVAPPSQYFWHALLWDENCAVQGQSTAKLYDGDNSHSIPFTADYLDEVRRPLYVHASMVYSLAWPRLRQPLKRADSRHGT